MWLWRGFRRFMHIFEGTLQHEYYLDLARKEIRQELEEKRQAYLQVEREFLQMIVQARFPMLTRLAETQVSLIKDTTTIVEVADKVSKAQTAEEATNALSWLSDDDSEE